MKLLSIRLFWLLLLSLIYTGYVLVILNKPSVSNKSENITSLNIQSKVQTKEEKDRNVNYFMYVVIYSIAFITITTVVFVNRKKFGLVRCGKIISKYGTFYYYMKNKDGHDYIDVCEPGVFSLIKIYNRNLVDLKIFKEDVLNYIERTYKYEYDKKQTRKELIKVYKGWNGHLHKDMERDDKINDIL